MSTLQDGLGEWAKGQTDFTYVLMDEEEMPVGAVLNEVIEGSQFRVRAQKQ